MRLTRVQIFIFYVSVECSIKNEYFKMALYQVMDEKKKKKVR